MKDSPDFMNDRYKGYYLVCDTYPPLEFPFGDFQPEMQKLIRTEIIAVLERGIVGSATQFAFCENALRVMVVDMEKCIQTCGNMDAEQVFKHITLKIQELLSIQSQPENLGKLPDVPPPATNQELDTHLLQSGRMPKRTWGNLFGWSADYRRQVELARLDVNPEVAKKAKIPYKNAIWKEFEKLQLWIASDLVMGKFAQLGQTLWQESQKDPVDAFKRARSLEIPQNCSSPIRVTLISTDKSAVVSASQISIENNQIVILVKTSVESSFSRYAYSAAEGCIRVPNSVNVQYIHKEGNKDRWLVESGANHIMYVHENDVAQSPAVVSWTK